MISYFTLKTEESVKYLSVHLSTIGRGSTSYNSHSLFLPEYEGGH